MPKLSDSSFIGRLFLIFRVKTHKQPRETWSDTRVVRVRSENYLQIWRNLNQSFHDFEDWHVQTKAKLPWIRLKYLTTRNRTFGMLRGAGHIKRTYLVGIIFYRNNSGRSHLLGERRQKVEKLNTIKLALSRIEYIVERRTRTDTPQTT